MVFIEDILMLLLIIKDCREKQTNTNYAVTVTEAIDAMEGNTRQIGRQIDMYSSIVAVIAVADGAGV